MRSNTGKPLTADEHQAIIDAYLLYVEELREAGLPEEEMSWSELGRRCNRRKETVRKAIRRYLAGQNVAKDSVSSDEGWMSAFYEFAKTSQLPIPEKVRALFGIPQEAPEPRTVEGPIIYSPNTYRRIAFISD